MLASQPQRLAPLALVAVFLLCLVRFYSSSSPSIILSSSSKPPTYRPLSSRPAGSGSLLKGPVAYDLTTPPSIGCEDVVYYNQQRLLEQYSSHLEGIRYANIIGYLDNEDKGNAAVWTGQWILLSMLGITPLEICRFIDKDCDLARFASALDEHAPHSAIILSGGGNFTDTTLWGDVQTRLKTVSMFPRTPIRAMPHTMRILSPAKIAETQRSFGSHTNLRLMARDLPSHNWLVRNYGRSAASVYPDRVKFDLLPDTTFMWGARPDLRTKAQKAHNILILRSPTQDLYPAIPAGEGLLDLGSGANITYHKLDWTESATRGIDDTHDALSNERTVPETGKFARAYARARNGFAILGSVDFVITNVLEAHTMSTVMGVPHVFVGEWSVHNDMWTRDARCARVTGDMDQALTLARLFFERHGGVAG